VSLRERVEGVNVAVLLSILVLLVLVKLLPESVRGALVMNYGSPSVLTRYTKHFVHAGWGHLAGNVGVYLVAVAAYVLGALRLASPIRKEVLLAVNVWG
jgi:membrane associated rhomboid family serine protease